MDRGYAVNKLYSVCYGYENSRINFWVRDFFFSQSNHQLVDTNAHDNEKVGSFAGDAKSFDTHTEECSGSITQKDVLIRKLKNDLDHARKQQQETSRELRDCELSIARLQGQIGKLQDERSLKRSDVAAKDHTLRAMEKQHMDNKVKVRYRAKSSYT